MTRAGGLRISAAVRRKLKEHALSKLHSEVCGFVYADVYVPLRNISRDPLRFAADPRDVARALAQFGEPIAIFHSHPNGIRQPSPEDLQAWHYPGSVLLIGTMSGQTLRLSSFRLP